MLSVSVVDIVSTVLDVAFALVRGHKWEGNLRKAGPFIYSQCFSSVVLSSRIPSSAGLCSLGTYFQ